VTFLIGKLTFHIKLL